jgi:hypothetical protein
LTLGDLINAAYANPGGVPTSTFDMYLGGQAKLTFDAGIQQAATEGYAYEGTPPQSRLSVVENKANDPALPQVTLKDCPLYSIADPYIAFNVATGQPEPAPSQSVAPPYAATSTWFEINGQWTMTTYQVDGSRTCTP